VQAVIGCVDLSARVTVPLSTIEAANTMKNTARCIATSMQSQIMVLQKPTRDSGEAIQTSRRIVFSPIVVATNCHHAGLGGTAAAVRG
jgi:hypothetical protein